MENKETALAHLRVMTGNPSAYFRVDQWEAIEAILKGERALVVQRTGWGKSAVYFIATAMIRERNQGVTLLISPLLSLIRNQMLSAKRLGLTAESINSAAPDDVPRVVRDVVAGKVDILLVAPERLSDERFQADVMNRIRIGLLVVDEAHCISDWGHDFRPDYRRIVRVVRGLPKTVPVLATTATANRRVVDDIREQLGDGLRILRGELTRESIHLQNLHMKDQSERLAWLVQTIPRIEGTGIVYCLTKADCTQVSTWLNLNGILSTPYFSGLGGENDDDRLRSRVEHGLLENRYKVVVATVALGMGFDKPDLSFVIHYQCPGSLIAYYQQVGRAGRALDRSYGILLHGREDREIVDYFIAQAFPPAERLKEVLRVLGQSKNGMKLTQIESALDIRRSKLEQCLDILRIEGAVSKTRDSVYVRTPNVWAPDEKHVEQVLQTRRQEFDDILKYTRTKDCLMMVIARELSDDKAKPCGKCMNCLGKSLFLESPAEKDVHAANRFLKNYEIRIEPRRKWASGRMEAAEGMKEGLALCRYGDAGWGHMVKEDKYGDVPFRKELVEASADLIRRHYGTPLPFGVIVAVPSLRHPKLVPGFAAALSKKLGLPFEPLLRKVRDTPPQKTMQNSAHQCENVRKAFDVAGNPAGRSVLLVDDMVDSRWTLTACAAALRNAGAVDVTPYALADSGSH
jgi:ATP-dependent DNA helicase RecQ